MPINKPSKNEDEFFAKEDAEILRKERDQARKAAEAAERKRHYMKCPRDEHDLAQESFEGITAQRCFHCGGLFLDKAEVDAVVDQIHPSVIGQLVQDFWSVLGRHPDVGMSGRQHIEAVREEQRRQRSASAEAEADRRLHPMICPKDGHDMLAEPFHTVTVVRCEHCHGIFLDAVELDEVIARNDSSHAGKFIHDFWAVLHRHRRGPK
jgi:hypothetical protein